MQLSAELLGEELATVAKKWYEFGQKMGLRSSTLHYLEKETGQDAEYYFKEMLTSLVGEERAEVSWTAVVTALREVGEGELSEQLAEKYGRRRRERERDRGRQRGEREREKESDRERVGGGVCEKEKWVW